METTEAPDPVPAAVQWACDRGLLIYCRDGHVPVTAHLFPGGGPLSAVARVATWELRPDRYPDVHDNEWVRRFLAARVAVCGWAGQLVVAYSGLCRPVAPGEDPADAVDDVSAHLPGRQPAGIAVCVVVQHQQLADGGPRARPGRVRSFRANAADDAAGRALRPFREVLVVAGYNGYLPVPGPPG
jgi:hypothetical protein